MAKHPNPPLGQSVSAEPSEKAKKARNTKETLRRLWGYLRNQRYTLLFVFLFTIMSTVLTLMGPYLMGVAIDDYIIPGDYKGLIQLCLLMLAIYFAHSLVTWIQAYIVAGMAQHTVKRMRQDIFSHLQKLPLSFFDNQTHGDLMSRTTNDMENVTETLNQGITQLLSSVMMLVGSLIFMLSMDVWLTLVSVVTIPLVLLASSQIAKHTRKYFSGQQKQLGELNGLIEETVSNQRVVKAFHGEARANEKFQLLNHKLKDVSVKAQIFSGMMGPFMNLINHLGFIMIAAVGSWMASYQWITIGLVVSFLNYSKQFGRPINELANQFNMLQSAIAGAERVFEIMDKQPEAGVEENRKADQLLEQVKGLISYDQVCFSYQKDVPILENITFTANPGEMVALVGPTGAGKTTIAQLLPRFYERDAGQISIDGVDINMLDKSSLRQKIGIVLQDTHVLSDTIWENIRYGRLDATDEEVIQAAKLAHADEFIRKLPQGYNTVLSSEGTNLSQGQRQLITIARAILVNPAILILDEATSNIDTRTEVHIQQGMKSLLQGRTSLVIAHRLSTIRDADLILYVDGGQIKEGGSHEELMIKRGAYYRLWSNQGRRVV